MLVGACLDTGSANAVIAACLKGQCMPLMGNALFNEYEDVFGRGALFKGCKLSRSERDEVLDAFFACCEWTRIYYTYGGPICRMRLTTIWKNLLLPAGRISS